MWVNFLPLGYATYYPDKVTKRKIVSARVAETICLSDIMISEIMLFFPPVIRDSVG